MSTRDEILAALTDHPLDGLTLKEIAPLCPACEFCEVTVGRMLGALKQEEVIHANGLRAGQQIYFFGKRPVPAEERREPPMTLASSRPPSEAARAIAAMRRPAAEQAPSRATSTPTAATPARPAVPQENAMKVATLVERCMAAMKKHGPCNQEQLAKHTGSTPGSVSTIIGQLKARGVQKHQPPTRGAVAVYFLPGQKIDGLSTGAELGKRQTPERGTDRSIAGVGNGGAAGPTVSPYEAAVANLRQIRAAKMEEVLKIDRAIEAVKALA